MKSELRFPWHLLIVFVLLTAGIVLSGYLYYENQKKHIRKSKEDELSAIADLKVDEIVKWRKERIGDANVIFQFPVIASHVQEWFEKPLDSERKEELYSWMKSIQENYDYQSIILIDTEGNVRLSTPEEKQPIDSTAMRLVEKAVRDKKVILSDIYTEADGKQLIGPTAKQLVDEAIRDKKVILSDIYTSLLPGNPIRISLVAPLFISKDGDAVPVGAVFLRIDPYQFLYPHIQLWPTPSLTSETMLVRREGDSVVYLNELRHRKNTALSFRLPMSRSELSTVKAIRGLHGVVEAVDYRGVPVAAALRAVPGTSWFLVAKVDMEEVFAPFHASARNIAALVIMFIVSSGLVLGLLWRRQEANRLLKAHDELDLLVRERSLELDLARRQNELILNNAGEGIYMLDLQGRVIFMNPAALRMLGYAEEEVMGKSSHQLFHHSKKDGTPYPFEECAVHLTLLDGEVHKGSDEVLWRKDGTSFPIDYISTPIKNGKLSGAVVIFKDITERKQGEEEKRKITESLNEAQRIAHVGNWELDLTKNILRWSDEIYRIFEIDPKLFGASYEAFLDAIHPDDRAAVDEAYKNSVKNRTPYAIEHRLLFPDGRIKYIHERCETSYDQDGKPVRSIGTVQDISERKRVEEEKNKLNEELKMHIARLEAANKELGAFSYNVSHDLRAPLRAIAGFSSIMMSEYSAKIDEEGRRILGVIKNNAQRMGRLVDGLTEYLRLGRKEIVWAELDMRRLVGEVIEEIRSCIPERNIEIDIKELIPCSGDRSMIKEVWINLLSNALKFTRPREKAAIEVGSKKSASASGELDQNIYYVKDNGVGFDMRYEDKLFNVFQHLHGMDEFEGAGIGLAVVKRIIEKHGGKVWAEGKVGEGATFYFSLPKRQRTEDRRQMTDDR